MEKSIIVKEYIDFYLEKNNLSKVDFSKKYNFDLELLEEILNREFKNVTLLVVFKLSLIIKVPMHKLAIFLDPEMSKIGERRLKKIDNIFKIR